MGREISDGGVAHRARLIATLDATISALEQEVFPPRRLLEALRTHLAKQHGDQRSLQEIAEIAGPRTFASRRPAAVPAVNEHDIPYTDPSWWT